MTLISKIDTEIAKSNITKYNNTPQRYAMDEIKSDNSVSELDLSLD